MGKVIIQEETTKNPITLIGKQAGICWGADTSDDAKNYKRGLDCLNAQHGRTFEFPDVYMVIEGYSARVIREWYTHIGGSPTRLQASTRYVNYADFGYIIPPTISKNPEALNIYCDTMDYLSISMDKLEELGIPREDIAMLLPLGMETKIVCKHNARNLIDMSHQRKCQRAYWEYRDIFQELEKALSDYSAEWAYLVEHYFKAKCDYLGYCPETYPCPKGKVLQNKNS